MTNFSLDNAIVYDNECFPNCFTFAMEMFNSDVNGVWEISEFRDDRQNLFEFLNWLMVTQAPMIGFNNEGYDYPLIHMLIKNPNVTYQQLYEKSMQIIKGGDRFAHTIWASDRYIPQIDLFKLHHFDNRARSTGLKALQINMRSETVVDMPVENGKILTKNEIDNYLIPYNIHDVTETKKFGKFSMNGINFRVSLMDQFGPNVLNWNDTKIGEQMVIQKLGQDVCYDRSSGKRKMRQTPRSSIAIKDVIFPYVQLNNPEFVRIADYMKDQTLRADQIATVGSDTPSIKTKGVFAGLTATTGGVTFHYGVGGIHGSVKNKKIIATDEWLIRDIDVASLYPSIAIVNNLAPEHLGKEFVQIYSNLPKERKKWQAEKGKKCPEANGLKLASNGVYGKSNSVYSPFYDPKFTMTITMNGQLLLSMLIEKLIEIPTLQVIQANTDGVTYYIHKSYEPYAAQCCREWEKITALVLEDADYSRMWIRDVNNYIAESTNGSLKLKGAYWTPDPTKYHESIGNAQPVSWHKNFSNVVSTRAAVAHMIHGIDVEQYIRLCTDPYDFLNAVKINKTDHLIHGAEEIQRNTRFYVSTDGEKLIKKMPAKGPVGQYKKANGISQDEYERVMFEVGNVWDPRVCTKNKSKYEVRETAINAGHKLTICNDIKDFRFDNINYSWYVNEAKKLLIG